MLRSTCVCSSILLDRVEMVFVTPSVQNALCESICFTAFLGWNGVICAGVILSVMGAALFLNVLGAPNPWPVC